MESGSDVEVYSNISSREEFVEQIQSKRSPAVIRGLDIGVCCEKWNPEYLISQIGHLEAKVHVSPEDSKLDFLHKNFLYKTLSLGEIIKRASQEIKEQFFVDPGEFYYLRSLSSEIRGREVADLRIQYPSIAADIKIPDFFDEDKWFSSVLRVSSKHLQLWTHYDIMDNLLIQVQGRKRVVLFDPADVKYLYLQGDKSLVLDIDQPNLTEYPLFAKARKFTCVLEPGDVLFIPALWFHNTLALSYGVGVNVFWKNLDPELYDKNDFYGNKDLLSASKAFQNVTNAIKALKDLPEEYKDFYLRRCVINIETEINSK